MSDPKTPLAADTLDGVVGLCHFEAALIKHGIIQAAAIEDAEGYDEGRIRDAALLVYENNVLPIVDRVAELEEDNANLRMAVNRLLAQREANTVLRGDGPGKET